MMRSAFVIGVGADDKDDDLDVTGECFLILTSFVFNCFRRHRLCYHVRLELVYYLPQEVKLI